MDRLGKTFLDQHYVELLLLGDLTAKREADWLRRIKHTSRPPCLILEFWPDAAILGESGGPMSKKTVVTWDEMGYGSTCSMINALQVGGVVDRTWLVVA
jgi:hypothetical protein